jgi:hypothetical protein
MGKLARKQREGKPPRIRAARMTALEREALVAAQVAYEGHADHKRNPARWGFIGRSGPRPDATLCEDAAVDEKDQALVLFKLAVASGLVEEGWTEGFPKRIWVVDDTEQVFELRHGGSRDGVYHGYPILKDNPFAEKVLLAWRAA